MKVLIIEDEIVTASRMFKLTSDAVPEAEILGPVPSIKAAKELMTANPDIDLVFSDIRLEDGLSFSLLDTVNTEAVVVFTTAYNEYALNAFEYNSVSYILKPVQKDDVVAAVEKYRKHYLTPNMEMLKRMSQEMKENKPLWRHSIVVNFGASEQIVPVNDISFIESEFGNTNVYLVGGDHGTVGQSLTKLSAELDPSQFLHVSRQHIVSISSVRKINRGGEGRPEIVMDVDRGTPIVCTRLTFNKLKDLLEKYSVQ